MKQERRLAARISASASQTGKMGELASWVTGKEAFIFFLALLPIAKVPYCGLDVTVAHFTN